MPTEDQEVVSEAEDAVSEEDSEEIVAEAEETEEELVEEEGIDIEADVQALLEGEELSEEFEEKARTIFEAAITSKVETIKEQLHRELSRSTRRRSCCNQRRTQRAC